MPEFAFCQPVEVISYQGVVHYTNAGFCLQCQETEIFLSENGGTLLATILPGPEGVAYLTVEPHDS